MSSLSASLTQIDLEIITALMLFEYFNPGDIIVFHISTLGSTIWSLLRISLKCAISSDFGFTKATKTGPCMT
jgi:hypothetical protein